MISLFQKNKDFREFSIIFQATLHRFRFYHFNTENKLYSDKLQFFCSISYNYNPSERFA